MSQMGYYCFQYVTRKKENVEQIKAIEEWISNQENDLKDTETDSTDEETDSENDLDKTKKKENHLQAGTKQAQSTKAKAPADKTTRISGKPTTQKKAICNFFLLNKGSHGKSGNQCKYKHSIKCKYHGTQKGCKYGNTKCKFWHPNSCRYGDGCNKKDANSLIIAKISQTQKRIFGKMSEERSNENT